MHWPSHQNFEREIRIATLGEGPVNFRSEAVPRENEVYESPRNNGEPKKRRQVELQVALAGKSYVECGAEKRPGGRRAICLRGAFDGYLLPAVVCVAKAGTGASSLFSVTRDRGRKRISSVLAVPTEDGESSGPASGRSGTSLP